MVIDLTRTPTRTTLPNGTEEWRLDGKLHRTDGPALTMPDGAQSWWHYGRLSKATSPHLARI